jgi:lipopolysaccharide/colanic/teichoic acid biosynthesis glycosyltransferase
MALKRAVDIILGTLLALAALPVIVILAIGCAIALRAWPFFAHRRVGKGGREFVMPKLRTLRPSVPGDATKYELDDAQIPRFCRLLRHTHLDELPQLLLVPIGLMSLVGPRPEMPSLLARYPEDVVFRRTRLRPGCTGLWQVSAASTTLIHESPEFDLAYVAYCNTRLDLWILFRTLLIGITRRADTTLADVPAWALSPRPGVEPEAVLDLTFYEELEAIQQLEPLSIDVDG